MGFVEPHQHLESEPGYLYHVTAQDAVPDIAASRLKTYRPNYGTDQDMWPDGSTEKRSYFTPHAGHAWQFAPESGKGALLRVHGPSNPDLFHRESTGDWYAKQPIHPKHLEVLTDDGWQGVGMHKSVAAIRRSLFKSSPTDIEIANRTARGAGRVGARALVPAYVQATAQPGDTHLDYGAGPEARHTMAMRSAGLKITAHEFGNNVREGVHDSQALSRHYHTVFASNVLNVQNNPNMLRHTLDQLASVVHPEGRLVVNLPREPRKSAWMGDASDVRLLHENLLQRFHEVARVGGEPGAPVLEARKPIMVKSKVSRTPWLQTLSEFSNPKQIEPAEGHRLLYHITPAKNLPSIRRHGLDPAKADETTDEPYTIWAHTDPHGYSRFGNMVTFQVPHDDPLVHDHGAAGVRIKRPVSPRDILHIDPMPPVIPISTGPHRQSFYQHPDYAADYHEGFMEYAKQNGLRTRKSYAALRRTVFGSH